jgi:DNA-3-methyladenine glycosylase
MHYCLNIVTGQDGYGAAVLIRAIEPISGIKYMKLNRTNTPDVKQLTNGPAKLCQALSIDKNLNGHDLTKAPLRLKFLPSINQDQIIQTTRIGISRDEHRPWRFYIKGNSFVPKLS